MTADDIVFLDVFPDSLLAKDCVWYWVTDGVHFWNPFFSLLPFQVRCRVRGACSPPMNHGQYTFFFFLIMFASVKGWRINCCHSYCPFLFTLHSVQKTWLLLFENKRSFCPASLTPHLATERLALPVPCLDLCGTCVFQLRTLPTKHKHNSSYYINVYALT